jgi:hypothetical protein
MLLALLQPQRLIQLQKWKAELQEEDAPQPPIWSIRFFEDADIANRASEILNDD